MYFLFDAIVFRAVDNLLKFLVPIINVVLLDLAGNNLMKFAKHLVVKFVQEFNPIFDKLLAVELNIDPTVVVNSADRVLGPKYIFSNDVQEPNMDDTLDNVGISPGRYNVLRDLHPLKVPCVVVNSDKVPEVDPGIRLPLISEYLPRFNTVRDEQYVNASDRLDARCTHARFIDVNFVQVLNALYRFLLYVVPPKAPSINAVGMDVAVEYANLIPSGILMEGRFLIAEGYDAKLVTVPPLDSMADLI